MCSVFLFKQKTAYEMRISDWSSDVCSSDLDSHLVGPDIVAVGGGGLFFQIDRLDRHADRICGRPVHGLMVLYRPPILPAERLASASLRPVTATRKCQGKSPVTKVSTDRKSVGWGKDVSVRVVCGGRRN